MSNHKIYSYFIGRYQPFHDGHKKLIQVVLDEGKNVCIAIRDTKMSKDNPFSVKERKKMIKKVFHEEINELRVKIIVIPDCEEVCWGREVGWGRRQINLDAKTEAISATKIREHDNPN